MYIEKTVDRCLYFVESGEIGLQDTDFLGEALGIVEDAIEIKLFEVFLLLVEIGTILVDILVDDLDRLVFYHLL